MALAWVLTVLALLGVGAGVIGGHKSDRFSYHLAAAGGGLLFGIALFWLVPEIGDTTGRGGAVLLAVGVAIALAFGERALTHSTQSVKHGIVWPLLLATAIHSLLDGWSVRLLSVQPLTNIAVTVGLALHKIPEGAAVGWIARRSLGKSRSAFLLGAAAELFTLAGALAEPGLDASGAARFGSGWQAGILALIAGAFLFLGAHAVMPAWKRHDVAALFLATLLLMGGLTFFRSPL